ncbi:hypothetical protein D3C84_523320 [compost metagenome]
MNSSGMCLAIKNISHPLINALVSELCFNSDCCVKCWCETQAEVARIGFLRGAAELGARLQIICDGLFKCGAKLAD